MSVIDLEKDVLEASHHTPILVDFWAPWCGPCRTLGPVLDQVEAESNGRFRLVKIDTDQQPDVASKYRVAGIPAVKLVVKGEVAAEFTGSLPKSSVLAWLEEHLPNPLKERLCQAAEQRRDGNYEQAKQMLTALLEDDPQLVAAQVELAAVMLQIDADQSLVLVQEFDSKSPFYESALQIRRLAELNRPFDSTSPQDERFTNANNDFFAGHLEAAIEAWIDLLLLDKSYQDGAPAKACVALFQLLGRNHKLVKRWRKRLEMAMF